MSSSGLPSKLVVPVSDEGDSGDRKSFVDMVIFSSYGGVIKRIQKVRTLGCLGFCGNIEDEASYICLWK